MSKNKKHKTYSIQEKNEIVLLYLDRHMSAIEIVKKYQLGIRSKLYKWIDQYKQYGTTIDARGRATKLEVPNKGRPRKYGEDLTLLSKEDLIERVKAYEDIKKSLVYLLKE